MRYHGILVLLGASMLSATSSLPLLADDKRQAKKPERPTHCTPAAKYHDIWKRVKGAKPKADAAASIARGDFRFRCSTTSHWEVGYHCGIPCMFDLYNIDWSDASPVAHSSEAQRVNLCGSQYAEAARRYALAYNSILAAHPNFPHKDICQPLDGKYPPYLEFNERISERPKPQHVPTRIDNVATAARFGRIDVVRKLLAQGKEVNAPDELGITGLEWAIVRGYEDIYDLLVFKQEDAKPSYEYKGYRSRHRFGELAGASRSGHLSILKKILSTIKDPKKYVGHIIEEASRGGSVEVMRYALDNLVVNRRDSKSLKRLEKAIHTAVVRGHFGVVKLMLERGVDPNSLPRNSNSRQRTLIEVAVRKRRERIVHLLLKHGARIDKGTLIYAVAWGDGNSILALIDAGLDPNTKDDDGAPVLTIAASNCRRGYRRVDSLISRGADPDRRDDDRQTPLMRAAQHGMMRDKRSLTGLGKKISARMPNAVPDNLDCIDDLIKGGADVTLGDKDGKTALHYAAQSDYHVPTIKLLVSAGADLNARDKAGKTALDVARDGKLVRVPKLLIELGATTGVGK